jgi:hypothetical protein
VSEYHHEPVRGLPGLLPKGERILWQGAPDWIALARSAFLGGPVAVYFGVLMLWRLASGLGDGLGAAEALRHMLWVAPVAAAALALIALLGWATARSTVYTITNRRVVLRVGVALTMSINVPFTRIVAASVKPGAGDRADIALSVAAEDRFAFLLLWPHARPWRLRHPEPMLRAVPKAASVARLLADALEDFAADNSAPTHHRDAPARAARLPAALVAAE